MPHANEPLELLLARARGGNTEALGRLLELYRHYLAPPPEPTLRGHRYWVHAVAFSPDGRTLATGAGQLDLAGEVKLWDVATGTEGAALHGHTGPVNSVAFAPDGRWLATAG